MSIATIAARARILLAIGMLALTGANADADNCQSGPMHHAVPVSGEVSGARQFASDLGFGWIFQLAPAPHGGDIKVLDESGYNLALATVPVHGDTNPRFLYGWHFRNSANTGPNEGDINAPQRERRFTLNDPRVKVLAAKLKTTRSAAAIVLWREHLENLEHLRSVIGFRGYGQRDPLSEYKGESFELFDFIPT